MIQGSGTLPALLSLCDSTEPSLPQEHLAKDKPNPFPHQEEKQRGSHKANIVGVVGGSHGAHQVDRQPQLALKSPSFPALRKQRDVSIEQIWHHMARGVVFHMHTHAQS